MSHFDYEASKHICAQGYPFYALIMAAMRQADTMNNIKLRAAFPETWEELQARYSAPGGYLPGETETMNAVSAYPPEFTGEDSSEPTTG